MTSHFSMSGKGAASYISSSSSGEDDGHQRVNTDSFGEMSANEDKSTDLETKQKEDTGEMDLPPNSIQKVLAHRTEPDKTLSFLVKYSDQSYIHSVWVSHSTLLATYNGDNALMAYRKIYPNGPPTPPYYDPSFDKPEYIIALRRKGLEKEYLVKWTNLGYEYVTWENIKTINNPQMIQYFEKNNLPPSSAQMQSIIARRQPYLMKPVVSVALSRHQKSARPYHIEGLNFLLSSWHNRRNPILADDPGLGKTLQAILFLMNLRNQQQVYGPFMIISTTKAISYWEKELTEWSQFKLLLFYGSRKKCDIMKEFEFYYPNSKTTKFDVLITTFEKIGQEYDYLCHIEWQCLLIDEATNMKSDPNLLPYLRTFRTEFKVCLTGTPMQNNLEDLWYLLNFLDPQHFTSKEIFLTKYGSPNGTNELNSLLKPIMLRRVKGDVEKSITPLEEVLIDCNMTIYQKAFYKTLFFRFAEILNTETGNSNKSSAHTLLLEIRKICNHPYLMGGAEDRIKQDLREKNPEKYESPNFSLESLIVASSKMIILDKLLTKLKAEDHRVLIFSQMTKILDIIETYLKYKQHKFQRLDGNVRGDDRQKAIDSFNAQNSKDFVFLLCTKTGGIGVNISAADTVIIYDSNWDPHTDIISTVRYHRIGQKKGMRIYRLLTTKTFERKIYERASIKLSIDKAVIDKYNVQPKIEYDEVEKILKYGAYYAFNDLSKENEDSNSPDIEHILKHSKIIKHEQSDDSSRSKSALVKNVSDDIPEINDPDFWKKCIPRSNPNKPASEQSKPSNSQINAKKEITARPNPPPSAPSTENSVIYKQDNSLNQMSYWTRSHVLSIMTSMLRYGWGRWPQVIESSNLKCNVVEVYAICHAMLGWLLKASSEPQPIIEAIYKKQLQREVSEYERAFIEMHKAENEQYIVNGSKWKLKRLVLLFLLHREISTCVNKPDGIVVPDVPNPPAEWWTEADDRALLYGTWQYGYQQYQRIKFSRNDEIIKDKALNMRLKSIANEYKQLSLKIMQSKGNEIPISHESLVKAMNLWSPNEHKIVLATLQNHGYPSKERFVQLANIPGKSPDIINQYALKILDYVKFGKDPQIEFGDPITPQIATRLIIRLKFFDFIREFKDSQLIGTKDRELMQFLDQKGFVSMKDSSYLTFVFGPDNPEKKLIKRIRELATQLGVHDKYFDYMPVHIKAERPQLQHATTKMTMPPANLSNTVIEMPHKLSGTLILINLGTVVYDRDTFHNDRYLYPAGFESEKLYISIENPNEKCWYKSMILDRGGKDPVFRVVMKDNHQYTFEGNAPSNPWLAVLKAVDDKRKELGLEISKSKTVSGPEFYGLAHQVTKSLFLKMENADKCKKFAIRVNQDERSDDADFEDPSQPEKDVVKEKVEKERKSKKHPAVKPQQNDPIILDFGALFKAAMARMQIRV